MEILPTLFTPRLILRKLGIDDVPALVKYANNKKISDRVLSIPHPYTEPDAVFRISYVYQGFKNKARYVFAIIYKETEELIGEAGLHLDSKGKVAELGYWVAEPYWGKGIASEAIAAAIKFGFGKLKLDTVYANCHVENIASGRAVEKNGFVQQHVQGNVAQYILTADK